MISVMMLKQFNIFDGFDNDFLEEIASISEEETIQTGDWLFHEGDEANSLYMIIDGQIELKLNMDRKRNLYVTLNTLTAGDALGWSSMIEPYIYRLGVMATAPTRFVKLNAEKLRILLSKYPEEDTIMMQRIAQAVGSRFTTLSEKAPELSWNLITARSLFTVSVFLTVVIGVYGIVAVTSSSGTHTDVLAGVLLCMVVPFFFFLLANMFSPSGNALRDNLTLQQRDGDIQ
jgi:CRP-like cAMP-binding protein